MDDVTYTSVGGHRMEFDEMQSGDVLLGGASIIGTRSYQQDCYSYCFKDNIILSVVCDGMGGLSGGEKASALGVGILCGDFREADFNEISIPYFLRKEAIKMDEAVFNIVGDDGKRLGAGTTVVATIIVDRKMYLLSVGDSKIYFIRDGKLNTVNREHNYRMTLDQKLDSGEITMEMYHKEEAQAEALISFLGIGNLSLIDIIEEPYELMKDDLIVLCSDGVYKSLTDNQILAVVNDNNFDVALAAKRLVNTSFEYRLRGQDNTTAIVMRIK